MMAESNLDQNTMSRCPDCGQRMEEDSPKRCPLCGFELVPDHAATSDDTTPFAQAFAHDQPGHRRMWNWVWTAREPRLKHLALMRTSAAARRFSLPYFLLLSAALGLLLGTHFGWRAVSASAGIEETGSVRPLGKGWLHVAAMPVPFRTTSPPATPVDLWWNAPQAIVATVAGFVSGIILLWMLFLMIRMGIKISHARPYRNEERMTAALHYSAAWAVPLMLSGLVLFLRPFSRLGPILQWSWYPSKSVVEFLAGFLATISLVLWWFWLLRLGSTAPADTRGRVSWFVGLGVPVLVGAAFAGWWLGMVSLLTQLFDSWKLRF